MRDHRWAMVLLVVAATTVGCGTSMEDAPRIVSSSGTGATVTAGLEPAPPERLVSCGPGLPFPLDATTGPVVPPDDPDPLFVALRAAIGPDRAPGELRVLARSEDEALLAEQHAVGVLADPGFAPFDYWYLRLHEGGWRPAGYGNCRLHVIVDGRAAHPWELDPAAPPPTPASTTLDILVHERGCASGRPATGRVREPHIVYGHDAIEISVTIDPPIGAQDCPSNPPTPHVVHLAEPLGDRQILDAGREPIAPPGPVGP